MTKAVFGGTLQDELQQKESQWPGRKEADLKGVTGYGNFKTRKQQEPIATGISNPRTATHRMLATTPGMRPHPLFTEKRTEAPEGEVRCYWPRPPGQQQVRRWKVVPFGSTASAQNHYTEKAGSPAALVAGLMPVTSSRKGATAILPQGARQLV